MVVNENMLHEISCRITKFLLEKKPVQKAKLCFSVILDFSLYKKDDVTGSRSRIILPFQDATSQHRPK
jgi:hypothetical protein